MPDINSSNRKLFIMKYNHSRLVAQSQIQAKEIRKIELAEEIIRCDVDIEAQKKVIEEMEMNIKQQEDLEKEEAAADKKK